MKAIVKKININQIHLFYTLAVLLIGLIISYVYFVNVITFNTAKMSNLEESMVDIKSSISDSEFKLIEKNRLITEEYAYQNGFVDIEETTFVYAGDDKGLSLNEPKP